MKRLGTSLAAVAMSGVIAFAATPPTALASDMPSAADMQPTVTPPQVLGQTPPATPPVVPTKLECAPTPPKAETSDKAQSYVLTGNKVVYLHGSGEWVDTAERAASEMPLNNVELTRSGEIKKLIEEDQNCYREKGYEVPGVPVVEKKSERSGGNFDAGEIAGKVLPPLLVIGGITWYLNQDGSTYVQDKSRKDSTPPTEEEIRISKDLKKGHIKEIQEQSGQPVTPPTPPDTQGQVPSGERGMNAETGSNTAARALFALLVFSVFGAAAFVARRKFA